MIKLALACVKFEKSFWGFKAEEFSRRKSELETLGEKLGFSLCPEPLLFSTAEEAADIAGKLNSRADFVILDTATFPEGKAAFAFIDSLISPFALWSRSESVRNSNIAHNSFCGANYISGCLAAKSKRCFKLFGETSSPEFQGRLSAAVRLADAAKKSSGSKIGLLGGVVPKFYDIDITAPERESLKKRWNIQFTDLDLQDIVGRAKSYSRSAAAEETAAFRARFSSVSAPDDGVEKIARLLRALRECFAESGLASLAVRCWPELQIDFKIWPCAAISVLNDMGIPTACEGDTGGALDMLLASKLSDKPSTLLDIVDWDDKKNSFSIWHCGPTALSWADKGKASLLCHNVDGKDSAGKAAFGLPAVTDMRISDGPVSIFRTLGAIDDVFAAQGRVITTKGNKICGCFGEVTDAVWNNLRVDNSFIREQIFGRALPHHFTVTRGHIFF